MRNTFLQVLLAVVVIFNISGCTTKINTAAPYQNITFVYGLLDMGDTAHYIRIQKSFLSSTLSAYDMARVPDSSFYLNLDVTVKELNKADGSVHNTFTLAKVNMNTEGYTKDTGIFFTDPSYAYKFKQAISSNYRYRLLIHNPQTGETDSAETFILNESPTGAGGFNIPSFDNQTASTPYAITLSSFSGASYYLNVSAPDSSLVVQGMIRFHWWDENISTGVQTPQSYDWNFASATLNGPASQGNSGVILTTDAIEFLDVLKSAMGTAPANTRRYLDSTDFFIYAGPTVLYNYQIAVAQQGIGITGNSIQPIFSNIAGKNVYGVFTTRAERYRPNVGFAGPTITYILNSPILAGTGVQNTISSH